MHCVYAQARFASLKLDWATRTGRQLGPATSLPHEYGSIPLSALPKDTTNWLVVHINPIVLSAKQGSYQHHFLVFGMNRLGK